MTKILESEGLPKRECDFCGALPDVSIDSFMSSSYDTAICWRCVRVAKRVLLRMGLMPDIKFTYELKK